MFGFGKGKKKIVFWIANDETLKLEGNIETEVDLIYFALAFITKLAWVFAKEPFIADQLYRRMLNMNKDMIEWVSYSEIPKEKKIKITQTSDLITNTLPSIGDLYIMESAFALLAYTYQIISPNNKNALLDIITSLTPHLENVDSSLSGLVNLAKTFNELFF